VFVLQYWFFLVTIGTICGFACYELLIFSYLLQVVQAEKEPGGPGASAGADAARAPEGGPGDSHRVFGG
jgi:hypothetical protein